MNNNRWMILLFAACVIWVCLLYNQRSSCLPSEIFPPQKLEELPLLERTTTPIPTPTTTPTTPTTPTTTTTPTTPATTTTTTTPTATQRIRIPPPRKEPVEQCKEKLMKWAVGQACPFLSVSEYENAFPCGRRDPFDPAAKKRPLKVVVGLMASSPVAFRAEQIHASWGQIFAAKNAIFYALDKPIDTIPVERQWIMTGSERVSMDTPGSANWRSLYALIHAARQFSDADWILMVDDDSWVNPWNFRLLIERFDPSMPLLFGYVHDFPRWDRRACFVNGGAGMLVSRETASRIGSNPKRLLDHWVRVNDVTLSHWARNNSVLMVHSIHMIPVPPAYAVDAEITSDFGDLISTHHIQPNQISRFFTIIKKKWESLGFNESYVADFFSSISYPAQTFPRYVNITTLK